MGVNNEKFDEKSCGIVVFREKNNERLYLILHYPSGHFDLPKGHVEDGENEHQTAIRELEEETGISDIKIIDDYRVPISYKYRKKGQPSNKQVIFFLGETETEAVKISHEHQDNLWLPYDAAFNKVTFDNAKNLIKKAERFLG